MTLKQPQPYAMCRVAGRLLVAASYSALTARADTAPAAGAKTYNIAMTFTTPAGTATPRLLVRAAEPFKVAMDDKGTKLMAAFVLTPADANNVKLDGTVECGNATTAHPVLVTRLGEAATVKLQQAGGPGCELTLVVSEAATAAPAK